MRAQLSRAGRAPVLATFFFAFLYSPAARAVEHAAGETKGHGQWRHADMRRAIVLALIVAASLLTAPAQATLIGDQITVNIRIPNVLDFNESGSTTVAADSSDAINLGNGIITFSVDPFASGIVVTLVQALINPILLDFASFPNPGSSIRMSDLDWTDAPGEVDGASIGANNLLFLNADTFFTPDSAGMFFQDAPHPWGIGEFLTIQVQARHIAVAVPEPATLTLFGTGLVGLALLARRRRKAA